VEQSPLIRFVGVVRRPQTWLGMLFHWLAFPLGLFYFVFLVIGLSLGVGLVVVWVGIPILLVVAGAWWLFGAFERWQARVLLGAAVPSAPREWERVDGVWAKLRAHFGSAATWKDLAYLLAKLAFGVASFTLLVALLGTVAWLFALPVFAVNDVPVVNGTWVPPLWFGILAVPIGILLFFVALHLLNAWSWVCARWAEFMFRTAAPAAPPAPPAPVVGGMPATGPAPAPPATGPAPPATASAPPATAPAPPAIAPAPPAPAPAPPAEAPDRTVADDETAS
jgi:hypothetical protein